MELTVDQALQQGIAAHKEGKLQDAERLYCQILQAQPNHPDANHNLGVLAVAVGKLLEAIPFFKQAVEANPQLEQFWLSYIDALIELERFDEAKRVLVEGEKSGVASEKLQLFHQQIQTSLSNENKDNRQGLKVSEKRERLAEKKKSKKRREPLKPSGAAPLQDQLNHLVGHYQAGRLEEAEALAILLTQRFPKHPFGWKALGAVYKQTGRLNESLLPMQESVALSPQDAEAHNNLANTLKKLGKLDDAEASYRKVIALKPDLAETHSNLGNTLIELGKLDDAEASCRKAIALKPDFAEAHSNLGVTLKELGRLDNAETSYRKAIALKPDYAIAHNNLGNTLTELGRLNEAEASCRKAIAVKPDFAEAHSNLGNTLKELGKLDDAEASYRKAIALKPDYAEAYYNLFELFETTNAIDELLMVLDEARSKTNSRKADFLYYETLALFRKERYAEADALILGIAEGDVDKVRKASYFKLKGDLRHRSQDYDAAFLCYENSNLTVKTSAEYQKFETAADRYFDLQGNMARELAQLSKGSSYTHRISLDGRQPTFLVGFPRSGTTLLDTILRTHSKINVVEEQAMVTKMRFAIGRLQSVNAIEAIDENDSEIASDAYHEELARHTNWSDESLLIDKLPLNLLQAPFINRIFPEAKFILAVRHPLDCILSCWMQTFKLNSAMANMVDLDRIVDFYCVAMDIFQLSQRRYGLNTHRVRYEALVENFEVEAANILSFLDLEWEAELRHYQATALARGKINTPSRSQVIKPIYKTASYRWKHYEKHLDKYKSKLAPWLEGFGY